jgi:hypothetical protein
VVDPSPAAFRTSRGHPRSIRASEHAGCDTGASVTAAIVTSSATAQTGRQEAARAGHPDETFSGFASGNGQRDSAVRARTDCSATGGSAATARSAALGSARTPLSASAA